MVILPIEILTVIYDLLLNESEREGHFEILITIL